MKLDELIAALSNHMPPVLRWCGEVAKRLRQYDIGLSGKTSGSANTDALTLADLTVQEILVAALRDEHPLFRQCRLEAEESTGDMGRFAAESEYTIALDPIDGTKAYRDRVGDGYAVMLNLRAVETVHYSLVYLPEMGSHGTWLEARDGGVVCGEDDPSRPATDVLRSISPVDPKARPHSKKVYLIGFQRRDGERAEALTSAGLLGYAPDDMPGSIYPLFARGEFGGSLIHSPNVYDFPVSLQLARMLGGDAVWVHNGEPVHFRELWNDERADMLRLPGIVACSDDRETLRILCQVARDWSPVRYEDQARFSGAPDSASSRRGRL